MTQFAFRALKPAVRHRAASASAAASSADGKTVKLWARNADGALAMDATATLA